MIPAANLVAPAPRTLAEVLAPISETEFFQNYLGKQFFYLQGRPGRFAGLLPWRDLNQILRHHDLDSPRLRLVKEGKPVPPENYTTYINTRKPGLRRARLRAPELTKNLQDGATLIIDSLDEIQEPVTELAAEFERSVRARIQVNMYAGWRTSRGFDLHRDGHDVVILQVSGRKRWGIYGFSPVPAPQAASDEAASAPSDPVWEGTLEDGDVLYIPRGCWHVAVPMDEPTLHLTIGLHHATGEDLIDWFVSAVRTRAIVRQDLPRFGSPEARKQYLDQLWSTISDAWRPSLLDDYFAYADGRVSPRPNFGLPWTASPKALPEGDTGWSLKWIVARPVDWVKSADESSVTIASGGKQWRFAAGAAPLLEKLESEGVCTIDQLYTAFDSNGLDSSNRDAVRAFIAELLAAGLAAIAGAAAE